MVQEAVSVRGARFGPDFSPDDVVRTPRGRFEMGFDTCDHGEIEFEGPPEFGSATYRMVRITDIRRAECTGEPQPDAGAYAAEVATGAWYDSARDGEGWLIEDLGGGLGLVYWFTFTPDGAPAWMIGVGEFADDGLWVDELAITNGTSFGEAFDPEAVNREIWGRLHFQFHECGLGLATWRSNRKEYGSGMIAMERLTSVDGVGCESFPDSALSDGAWSGLTNTMPTDRSEMVGVAVDGKAYVVGGFGGFGRMESLDPETGEWTEHASIPRGRNHHFAAGYRHKVYVFGGFVGEFFGRFEQSSYVFDPATDTWERLSDLPLDKASGYTAVVLGDLIYLVGGEPSRSVAYDPATDTFTTFAAPEGSTDHSQALSYRGELWVMGGRGVAEGERNDVQIYNPLTRQWRAGPPLNQERSGFGAAVVSGQMMVVAGEIIASGRSTLTSLEIFEPATQRWVPGPDLPTRLHGLATVSLNGALYTFGGSRAPGAIAPQGMDFVYRP